MSKEKDFMCSIISLLVSGKNRECKIRHCYEGKSFKIFKGLKEMKSLKVKVLIKPEHKDTRFRYRGIWLCYEIFEKQKCDYCGAICGRDKLRKVTRVIHQSPLLPVTYGAYRPTTIHERLIPDREVEINICPKCAFRLDKLNDLEACKKCKNRTCGLTEKGIRDCIHDREETQRIKKEIKEKMRATSLSGKPKKVTKVKKKTSNKKPYIPVSKKTPKSKNNHQLSKQHGYPISKQRSSKQHSKKYRQAK